MPSTEPKKSVALSGVVAGNTAICTVGRSGNDLHYRGYDILDIAEACEFEEIAHFMILREATRTGDHDSCSVQIATEPGAVPARCNWRWGG